MADVIVVGDGPGGLSAALFLAKNGLEVVVYGEDDTAMNWAWLKNYLGLPEIGGTEFQQIAKAQVQHHGATLRADKVTTIAKADDGFTVSTEGDTQTARYLVLSEGKKPVLALQLGLEPGPEGLDVDRDGRTAVDGVYAIGRMVRPGRSQAIISAGDGAAAALDILARVKGKPRFSDWDSPE